MKLTSFLFLLTPLLAGIAEPRAGVILGRDGAVREIAGVAGAFLAADTLAPSAVRVACSGRMLVVKFDRSIRTTSGVEFEAPPGDAILGFDRTGLAAWAYFPSDSTFARITEDGLEYLPLDPNLLGGDVLAIGGNLTVWVRRDDTIHAIAVRLTDGAIESDLALPINARFAAALSDGTLVSAIDATLTLTSPDAGTSQSIDLPDAVESLAPMGDGWVHIRTTSANMTVRLREGAPQVLFIPEVAQ